MHPQSMRESSMSIPSRADPRTGPKDHPSVVPIDLPTMTALPQFGGDYRRSMLWGTYRPGLYFGACA